MEVKFSIEKDNMKYEIVYDKSARVKYCWQVIGYVGKVPFVEYAGETKKDCKDYIEEQLRDK